MYKKRRFKQRQKEQEFESSPIQQDIQNDRTLYIDEDSVTDTLETALEKCEELGRNLTDEEFKEIFEKKMRMKVN